MSFTILGTLDQDFESSLNPFSLLLRWRTFAIRNSGVVSRWRSTSTKSRIPLPTPSQLPPMDQDRPSSIRTCFKSADDAGNTNTHLTRESWLDRHHKKQRRTKCIGWLIVLFTIIVVVAIVLVVLWLLKMGIFQRRS